MKGIVSITVLSVWLLSWGAPILNAHAEMTCCGMDSRFRGNDNGRGNDDSKANNKSKGNDKNKACKSQCGKDSCCGFEEAKKSDSAVPAALFTINPKELKNPLERVASLSSFNTGILKEHGIHLSREPTLGSKWPVPSYLKHKHFLI